MKEGDKVSVSEKQLQYAKTYISKLDEIKIRIPKGKKEEYKKIADTSGKSLNQFIVDCIEAKIKK